MKFYAVFLLIICLTAACGTGPGKQENIFLDKILQKIYTLQDERRTAPLFDYFKDKNPKYRRAAALACASIQDKKTVEPLASLLADESEAVRCAAAYALGQCGTKPAAPLLIKAYEKEKSPVVKRDILEALGKCGSRKGLEFLTGLKFRKRDNLLLTGRALGIYRFALRGIISQQGTVRAIELSAPGLPERASFMAANYLSRSRSIDLTPYRKELIAAFKKENSVFTRMNLLAALGKAKHPDTAVFLKEILKSTGDYRFKVNALRALRSFDYEQVKEAVFDLLTDANVNVAVSAAQYIGAKGVSKDAGLYLEKAHRLTGWRSRTLLLEAALKYSPAKEDAAKAIISVYNKSTNIYEKGHLLQALSEYPPAYKFVEAQVFSDLHLVVKNYGLSGLIAMRKSKNFPTDNREMQAEFARILKKAVASGDIAVIGQAATALRDPKLNFKNLFSSFDFLKTALEKLRLPADIEAFQQLQETIGFFYGAEAKPALPPQAKNPIDWELVTSISPRRQVKVSTVKGDIIIALFVDSSPGSVSNFIRLIEQGYYKDNIFHRAAPNFVIQGGCPRGDGWGGPDFSIRSEFGPLYYEEGSVGMASAGKDSEGSQWFITHSPTPHLDGRYTIFGRVVSGMAVVHKIGIGDKITAFEIIK
ncbi:MAG: peptidylprolyl isomerase [Candidatus Aminicenantes bacterium]|nr:peptidylprolyl isomerase [Candidatus Aminicenantes bacterium]